MTTSLQVIAAESGNDFDGNGNSGRPDEEPKRIPLRIKVWIVGIAGLVNTVACMLLLYPALPHGKPIEPPVVAAIPTKPASPPPLQHAGSAIAGVNEVLSQLATHQTASGSLLAIENSELQSMKSRLDLAEREGSQRAKYLAGLLDYLVGQTNTRTGLQDQGVQRIRAAAESGLYLARFDSAVLLRKPYPLDDEHYRSAREAAAQGNLPASIDTARYLLNLGRDAEALPILESTHAWNGSGQSAAGDNLAKFRMALPGPATAAFLNQYSGLSKYLLAMLLVEGKSAKSDLPRARRLLAESSRAGITAASVAYSRMLLSGQGGEVMPQLAMDALIGLLEKPVTENACALVFEECSQAHRDMAAYLVALNHFAATPGFEKVRNSLTLLQSLSAKGNLEAKSLLGWVLTEGIETRRDSVKGIVLLTEAADGGIVDAKYRLARCFLDGNGTKRDMEKGIALLTNAASAGHPEAGALLATIKK